MDLTMHNYRKFAEHLKAIGLASVLWANFDAQVLAALIRIDVISVDDRYRFREKCAGKRRYEFAQKLLNNVGFSTKYRVQLYNILNDAAELWGSERNLLAHGQYSIVTDDAGIDILVWWDLAWGEADARDGFEAHLDDLNDHTQKVQNLIDRAMLIQEPHLNSITARSTLRL